MRKKSHISLARYIVNNMEDNDLKKHKLSFYIGSVLPDIKPSFVYKRHEMDGTYPDIRRHIERLSEGRNWWRRKKGASITWILDRSATIWQTILPILTIRSIREV